MAVRPSRDNESFGREDETETTMATPKKRHSRGRSGRRQSHDHLTRPQVTKCVVSGLPKMPHRVCEESGYYGKDKKVFEVAERL